MCLSVVFGRRSSTENTDDVNVNVKRRGRSLFAGIRSRTARQTCFFCIRYSVFEYIVSLEVWEEAFEEKSADCRRILREFQIGARTMLSRAVSVYACFGCAQMSLAACQTSVRFESWLFARRLLMSVECWVGVCLYSQTQLRIKNASAATVRGRKEIVISCLDLRG